MIQARARRRRELLLTGRRGSQVNCKRGVTPAVLARHSPRGRHERPRTNHAYLTIPETGRDGWRVELPVTRSLLLDANMIPTGRSEPIDCPRFELGDSGWDNAFGGPARPSRFAVSAAGRRIELEFIEGYPYAQVFSPFGESFICLEPMTAQTNALVSGIDLPVVAPGEEFRATFRIAVAAQG